MRKVFALLGLVVAICFLSSGAKASRGYGPPCPDTHRWHLSSKAYAQWKEFKLFEGSWGERHKVMRQYGGDGVVVKVWRPAPAGRCKYSQ
jgi:hypothetical protein